MSIDALTDKDKQRILEVHGEQSALVIAKMEGRNPQAYFAASTYRRGMGDSENIPSTSRVPGKYNQTYN